MNTADIIVLIGYFVVMVAIGIACAFKTKNQEDFFLGGRGFGKLLQTFAAFGAGTGAQDPINVGRTTWTSGLSGIWSTFVWLYVTPFYWIFGTWYRRMRHLTLGDWFVERYESPALGAAYTVYGFVFYIFYLSTMFSAISKVAEPLIGDETVLSLVSWIGSDDPSDLKYVLVPLIAGVVVAYGVVGGLAAAYWTDLVQGLCIILLSILLIPTGLSKLVERFGSQYASQTNQEVDQLGLSDGLSILHHRLGESYFQLFGGPRSGEFPLHFVIFFSLLALLGIVVQPHFITVGGGSAKSENSARIGLVTGNFLKRFCSIGWAISGLIVVALFADNLQINDDPDRAWGIASREILGGISIAGISLGLVGLMFACLLAALMSSASCYMLVTSALLVRNVYAAFIDSSATEKKYVALGRLSSFLVILGASVVSLIWFDVFAQYKLALEIAILFAAPFWLGMYWRRATTMAAWVTVSFSLSFFFILPTLLPGLWPSLRTNPEFAFATDKVSTTYVRRASAADVAKREAAIRLWAISNDGKGIKPTSLNLGDEFIDQFTTGGKPVFWNEGILPKGETLTRVVKNFAVPKESKSIVVTRDEGSFVGQGSFQIDYYLFHLFGMKLRKTDDALLATLRIPLRLFLPFLVMIGVSLVTRTNSKTALDRYYAKMKTPVQSTPQEDEQALEHSYATLDKIEKTKLFPGSSFEFQKPGKEDIWGFVACVAICFAILGLIYWISILGS